MNVEDDLMEFEAEKDLRNPVKRSNKTSTTSLSQMGDKLGENMSIDSAVLTKLVTESKIKTMKSAGDLKKE